MQTAMVASPSAHKQNTSLYYPAGFMRSLTPEDDAAKRIAQLPAQLTDTQQEAMAKRRDYYCWTNHPTPRDGRMRFADMRHANSPKAHYSDTY